MFFSGLFLNLSVGYYLILALSLSSLIYIVYKTIKKEIEIWSILTPGLSFFIIAFTVYFFSTQGALLHLWDEATHWGTSAKKMFYNNELWSSGLQTIATPVFNQVMLKTTGYSESALYLSQWTLYLACITLPLSHIKWKKSYLVAIFAIATIFAVSSIMEDGSLSLYSDGILGIFFGTLFITWHLDRESGAKRYIWMLPGLFMLVQIKNGSGMSLAVMLLIFMLVSDALIKNNDITSKTTYLRNLRTLSLVLATIALSQATLGYFNKSYGILSAGGVDFSSQMLTSIVFKAFFALFSIAFILFIIYSINIFRSRTNIKFKKIINKLLLSSVILAFISIIGVLFYSTVLRPMFDVRTTVLNFFTAFQKVKILGIEVMYLIAIIIAVYIINILLSKKDTRKKLIVFYLSALLLSGLYLYGVLYAYLSSFSLSEAVNMASFDRYVGTALLFATMFAFLPLLRSSNDPIKKSFFPYIPLAICTILLAINFTPVYKTAKLTSDEALIIRETEILGAKHVQARVDSDKKVFLVIQNDMGLVFNWMRYEFAPITTNGGIWSFGDDGGWNFAWDEAKLTQFFIDANYDYLYLFKTSDYFNTRFQSLFGEVEPQSKTLYKFSPQSEIVFEPVD